MKAYRLVFAVLFCSNVLVLGGCADVMFAAPIIGGELVGKTRDPAGSDAATVNYVLPRKTTSRDFVKNVQVVAKHLGFDIVVGGAGFGTTRNVVMITLTKQSSQFEWKRWYAMVTLTLQENGRTVSISSNVKGVSKSRNADTFVNEIRENLKKQYHA